MKHRRYVGVAIGLLAILGSLFPSRWVLATGGDGGFEKEVNGYQVRLHFSGHAKTGNNPVEVQLTAPNGEPVSATVVEVSAEPGAAHSDAEPDAHTEEPGEPAHMEAEPQAAEEMDEPGSEAAPETGGGMDMHGGGETGQAPAETAPATGGMDMHGGEDTAQPPADTQAAEPADTHAAQTGSYSDGETAEGEIEPCNVEQPCTEEAHAEEGAGGHGESGTATLKPDKEPGRYAGKVFFSEPGDWAVKVHFTIADPAVEEHVGFTVDVLDAGPNWPVLGGFFGINGAIIAVAAVFKRKSTLVLPA